jgi:hypothetical protein
MNSESINQISALEILKSSTTFLSPSKLAVPKVSSEVVVGQIRSIQFINSDGELDHRFVLIVSMASKDSSIVQAILIGQDKLLAGKNDVYLSEHEVPSFEALVIQTDLRLPVLRSDLGPIFSEITDDTLQLLSQMSSYSGRDLGRTGVHRNNADLIRQDYIRSELDALRSISRSAFIAMSGPDYKSEMVKQIDAGSHSLTIHEIRNAPTVFKTLPESTFSDRNSQLEYLVRLKEKRSTRGKVAA